MAGFIYFGSSGDISKGIIVCFYYKSMSIQVSIELVGQSPF